jgi:ABC-type antimicrobial peptide transport system permease subunit
VELAPAIRQIVRDLDPTVPIYDVRRLDEYTAAARAPSRFTMLIAIVFASTALGLACIGVYGVVAYTTGERAREFGIRRALGATPHAILTLALGSAVRLGAIGLLIGSTASFGVSRLMRGLLFGVAPNDPLIHAVAMTLLGGSVFAASWLPARRAAAAPLMDVLRDDS